MSYRRYLTIHRMRRNLKTFAIVCLSIMLILVTIPLTVKYNQTNYYDLTHTCKCNKTKIRIISVKKDKIGKWSKVKPITKANFTNSSTENVKTVRWPDSFIIGEMKCGTSAMQFFLQHHPDIAMPGLNVEANFFSVRFKWGWEWYRKQLAEALPSQISMEKSVYFGSEAKEEAWRRIYEFKPDAKLILNLRDPVERILSHYNMMSSLKNFYYKHSLEDFIYRRDNPKVINSSHFFIYRGHYYTNMLRWIKYFPLRQILIIDSKTFKKNPLDELIRVEKHLGIRPFFNKETFYFDKQKGFHCLKLNGKAECMPSWATSNVKRKYKDELVKELTEYYKPQVVKFYELVGQNYNWTTGR